MDADGFISQESFTTKVEPNLIRVKIVSYDKKFIGQS
jgi:hypothetical protein